MTPYDILNRPWAGIRWALRVRWFRKAHSRIRDEHLIDFWNDIVAERTAR